MTTFIETFFLPSLSCAGDTPASCASACRTPTLSAGEWPGSSPIIGVRMEILQILFLSTQVYWDSVKMQSNITKFGRDLILCVVWMYGSTLGTVCQCPLSFSIWESPNRIVKYKSTIGKYTPAPSEDCTVLCLCVLLTLSVPDDTGIIKVSCPHTQSHTKVWLQYSNV